MQNNIMGTGGKLQETMHISKENHTLYHRIIKYMMLSFPTLDRVPNDMISTYCSFKLGGDCFRPNINTNYVL